MSAILPNATCVAIDSRGILIEGIPGSGKSSLALALIDRGATLVGDDGVALEKRNERAWASPPPNTAGKLEVRNVGLVDFPAVEAPVALVLRLEEAAPRFIDRAEEAWIEGCAIPLVRLWPDSPVLPLRVEQALKHYGLG